jgi:hypothetical protein
MAYLQWECGGVRVYAHMLAQEWAAWDLVNALAACRTSHQFYLQPSTAEPM